MTPTEFVTSTVTAAIVGALTSLAVDAAFSHHGIADPSKPVVDNTAEAMARMGVHPGDVLHQFDPPITLPDNYMAPVQSLIGCPSGRHLVVPNLAQNPSDHGPVAYCAHDVKNP